MKNLISTNLIKKYLIKSLQYSMSVVYKLHSILNPKSELLIVKKDNEEDILRIIKTALLKNDFIGGDFIETALENHSDLNT